MSSLERYRGTYVSTQKEAPMIVRSRALNVFILASLGILAVAVFIVTLANQPDNVYPVITKPIARKVYDQRISTFAAQIDNIQIRHTVPAIYSEQADDVKFSTNEGADRDLKGYPEEYQKTMMGLRAVPTIVITASDKNTNIQVNNRIARTFPYIILMDEAGDVIPVYRRTQKTWDQIDHQNLETRKALRTGIYILVIVDMPNEVESDFAHALSVTAYLLDLRPSLHPVNTGTSKAWIFSIDQELFAKMNPYHTGQHIFVTSLFAQESQLGLRPSEEVIVMDVDYYDVTVSFASQNKPMKLSWKFFQAEPVR